MNGKKVLLTGTKMIDFNNKQDKIPEEFKKIAKDFSEKGFVTTSSVNLITVSYTHLRAHET